MIQRSSVTAGGALIGLALAAGTATANFDMYFLSDTNWGVRVYGLPDLDQKRGDLPGNGNMYCVPTSAVNAYAYVAHHGYPGVTIAEHNHTWWRRVENYDYATAQLALTGFIMSTDADDGTGGGGITGFKQMEGGAADDLLVMHFSTDKDYYALAFDDLAGWARAGAIVVPTVGWFPDLPITSRNGGHAVTLAGAWRLGPDRVIAFRDPATDEPGDDIDLNAQSNYATSVYNVVPTFVQILTGYGPVTRVMDQVVGMSSGDTLALLDGFFVIYPVEGFTTSNDDLTLVRLRPGSWDWDPHDVVEDVLTAPRPITDVLLDPATGRMLYVTEPDTDFPAFVWRYDRVTESAVPIVGQPVIDGIEISRSRRLYVRSGTTIRCYSIVGSGAATETASATLPSVMTTMCYDDVNDRLYFINGSSHTIYPYGPDLVPLPVVQVPGGSGLVGPGSMAASPVDGSLWVTTTLGATMVRLDLSGPVAMDVYALPTTIVFPGNLNVTNSGRLHLTSGGVIRVLEVSPQDTLVEVPGAPFAGLAAGGSLQVPHDRTNHDPAVMETAEYFNVLPTVYDQGVPDCLADITGPTGLPDGTVGILDFLALLSAWAPCAGEPGCAGDITGAGGEPDGQVGILDFLELLAAWGPCGELPLVP